ncbi:MAG: hypothetical protein OSB21_11690 [Myxococcota bacterium]|nr:hypothetical protein [Myxococcota bacterium]
MRALVAICVSLLSASSYAHTNINLLDLHLGGQRRVVEKRLRQKGCRKLSASRHNWYTDWNHRRTKRSKGKRSATAVYWCKDADWPEASLRELHFDGRRLHRVVIHLNYEAELRDPKTGSPFIPKYKEVRRVFEERLGPPDERREEMPKAFGSDQLRALEQRRGGFWSAWYGRKKGKIDVGLRLSGNPERPGELIFYIDARDRRIGQRILKRKARRIRPERGF